MEPSTREQTVGLALLKGAVVDADQTESAEEVGGVDVGDVGLQRRAFLVFRSRMFLMMASNSGSRLSLSGRPPFSGWFSEA